MPEGCERGEGLALARPIPVADDIAAGRLTAPIDERLEAELNDSVVWPRHPAPGEAVRRLADWLRREADGTG